MYRKPKALEQAITSALSLAVICFLLAGAGSAQTGTAREAFKGSADFQDAIAGATSRIEKYLGHLEKIERSLARLRRSDGHFAERYESFAKDLRKLEEGQKSSIAAVEKMRAREAGYFAAWDKANMQIADPELRRAAAERRSRVMTKYQELADDLSTIGRDLQPLMSHLRDLDLVMAADRSRATVKETVAMIELTREEARSLKQEIADVQRVLQALLNETLGKG